MGNVTPIKPIIQPRKVWEGLQLAINIGAEKAASYLINVMEDEAMPAGLRVTAARDLVAMGLAQMRWEAQQGNPDGNTFRIELGDAAKRLLSPSITECDSYEPEAAKRAGMSQAVREDGTYSQSTDSICIDID